MTSDLPILAGAHAAVLAACRTEYPHEVCGLIGARDGVLVRVWPVRNVAEPQAGACGFLMDSRAQLRAMREMEDADLELGAIYHSHPNTPAVPSDGDVRLAAYPEAAHLIASLVDPDQPEVRAWRIADGQATELTTRLIPSVSSTQLDRG
ncbi:MAG TPA: M67 family metallopeptidase [Actinomycetota bacterium]